MGSPDTKVCSQCAIGKHKKCDQKVIPGTICECLQCETEKKEAAKPSGK